MSNQGAEEQRKNAAAEQQPSLPLMGVAESELLLRAATGNRLVNFSLIRLRPLSPVSGVCSLVVGGVGGAQAPRVPGPGADWGCLRFLVTSEGDSGAGGCAPSTPASTHSPHLPTRVGVRCEE